MLFSGENAESYYDEGVTSSMKGDLNRAIQCFENAVKMEPGMLAARHQLAKCYLRVKRETDAVRLLDEVVKYKPDQKLARLDLGFALISLGDYVRAERHFEQVISLEPGNWRAMMGLAKAAFSQGRWDRAMTYAKAALDSGGPSFGVLFVLGRAARLAGALDVAEDALDQADAMMEKSAEIQPDQPEGPYFQGEVAFARDKFSTALEHYQAAEDRAGEGRSYPAFGEVFAYEDTVAKQGLCMQRLGKNDRAAELGRRVLALNPEHAIGKALSGLEPEEEQG